MSNQIRVRLSDGYSWAHEFGASSVRTLRIGCRSAWNAYHQHLNSLIEAIPPYHTMTRERQASDNKYRQTLQVHVRDAYSRCRTDYWINSMWGTNAEKMQLCLDPFRFENDWTKIWQQCVRCDEAAAELAVFIGGVAQSAFDINKPVPPKLTIINGGNNNGR